MARIIHEVQDLRYLTWSKIKHSSGTAGSFLKAYDALYGRRTYYKLSDYDSVRGVVGHECVNELIVDRLLDLMRIGHLHYTLIHARIRVQEKEIVTWLCASEDFRGPDERKLSLEDFYQAEHLPGESPFDFCIRMGWKKYICDMLMVDYLILNRDRHGANIEVLQDREKKTVRPAPLFDHGVSLLCRCQDENSLKDVDVLEDKKIQSFIGSMSAADNLALVPKQTLRRLPAISKEDKATLFDGLEDVLSKRHLDLIWQMITERRHYIETLCST